MGTVSHVLIRVRRRSGHTTLWLVSLSLLMSCGRVEESDDAGVDNTADTANVHWMDDPEYVAAWQNAEDRATYSDENGFVRDAIEFDPEFRPTFLEIRDATVAWAKQEGIYGRLGGGPAIAVEMQRRLWVDHKLIWRSHLDLNPKVSFD